MPLPGQEQSADSARPGPRRSAGRAGRRAVHPLPRRRAAAHGRPGEGEEEGGLPGEGVRGGGRRLSPRTRCWSSRWRGRRAASGWAGKRPTTCGPRCGSIWAGTRRTSPRLPMPHVLLAGENAGEVGDRVPLRPAAREQVRRGAGVRNRPRSFCGCRPPAGESGGDSADGESSRSQAEGAVRLDDAVPVPPVRRPRWRSSASPPGADRPVRRRHPHPPHRRRPRSHPATTPTPPVPELPRPDLYLADPALNAVIGGYRCQGCGLVVSEDGRKKEKLGGANAKGLAKAKCPKCGEKFGQPTRSTSSPTAERRARHPTVARRCAARLPMPRPAVRPVADAGLMRDPGRSRTGPAASGSARTRAMNRAPAGRSARRRGSGGVARGTSGPNSFRQVAARRGDA